MAMQHSLTRVLCLVFVSGELLFFDNFINNTYLVDGRDSARDITNFLLHFMPTSATDTPLPTHLPRVSPAETASRIKNGFTQRTFIAIGHSFSGRTS